MTESLERPIFWSCQILYKLGCYYSIAYSNIHKEKNINLHSLVSSAARTIVTASNAIIRILAAIIRIGEAILKKRGNSDIVIENKMY